MVGRIVAGSVTAIPTRTQSSYLWAGSLGNCLRFDWKCCSCLVQCARGRETGAHFAARASDPRHPPCLRRQPRGGPAPTGGDNASRPLNPLHSNSFANHNWSLLLDCHYEQALHNTRQAIHRSPKDHLWAFRHIVAALAELGRLDEARTASRDAEVQHPYPLSYYQRRRSPWQHPEDTTWLLASIKKAGFVPDDEP